MSEKRALFFGCWSPQHMGHFLYNKGGMSVSTYPASPVTWWDGLMDGWLLKNGEHDDKVTGKVWWTCGGRQTLWYAFFWWDRSGDSRGASNSGFYVSGFGFHQTQEAFDFACSEFPEIVKRQALPLVLQDPAFPNVKDQTSASTEGQHTAERVNQPCAVASESVAVAAPIADEARDAARYRWLRDVLHRSVGGGVEVNDAALVYETPEPGKEVRLYWYPHTPVGFNESAASTLDEAIDAAIAAERGADR